MLTPIEEAGLAGLGVAGRIRRALWQIPEPELRALLDSIAQEAGRRHLVYLRDDREETIRLLAMPVAALPDQLAYVRAVALALHGALKRLPELYVTDPDVCAALQLPPAEDEWLRQCWTPAVREQNTVFGRHDAVVDFTSANWKNTLAFVEPNLGGIGGLHLVPTAERILADLVVPVLRKNDPLLQLEVAQDMRNLLMQEMIDHLQALGRPARTICFIDPKYAGSGPDEQSALTEHFHARFGITVCHADPRELERRGDEVYYEGQPIDLAYRDYPIIDLLALAREGVDIGPMRLLFEQNRIVSSIAAELDQKSCWEVLGEPTLAERHFSADERQLFRRHLPWTRLIADRATTLLDGSRGPLLEYVRREREQLVLKPNRAYGGTGIHLGPSTPQGEWDALIDRAVADPERWVAQQLVNLPVLEFPVLDPAGHVHAEPFFTVMGFAPSTYGLATLVRASQKQVVNIAQRGGMCALMVAHPPGRIVL
ncbi:MAG TPA: hypothetical protein VH877_23800 [Polyangia bacterium]|jgi:hypothetical protein|nr:hypothetical protein [Polyangia bacterium]